MLPRFYQYTALAVLPSERLPTETVYTTMHSAQTDLHFACMQSFWVAINFKMQNTRTLCARLNFPSSNNSSTEAELSHFIHIIFNLYFIYELLLS